VTGNRREVEGADDLFVASSLTHENQDARFRIMTIDPLETRMFAVEFMQCRFVAVEGVQIGDHLHHALMRRIFE